MSSLTTERLYPYIIAMICASVWVLTGTSLPEGPGVLSASLTLGAILTGFLSTAKAIVMSSMDSPVMDRVKSSNYLSDLISYLKQAIWLSFGFSVISLVGFFLKNSDAIYGVIWLFVGVAAGGAFIRVTNILLKIIGGQPS